MTKKIKKIYENGEEIWVDRKLRRAKSNYCPKKTNKDDYVAEPGVNETLTMRHHIEKIASFTQGTKVTSKNFWSGIRVKVTI